MRLREPCARLYRPAPPSRDKLAHTRLVRCQNFATVMSAPAAAAPVATAGAGVARRLPGVPVAQRLPAAAEGVVHRDLKPPNVLLAEDCPRVIDFGISRAVESTALTQAGLVIGSPGFMSPEQAAGYEVGPSTTSSAWGRSSPSPPLARARSALGPRRRCCTAWYTATPPWIGYRAKCGR